MSRSGKRERNLYGTIVPDTVFMHVSKLTEHKAQDMSHGVDHRPWTVTMRRCELMAVTAVHQLVMEAGRRA